MRIKRIVFIAILAALIAGGFLGWRAYTRKPADICDKKTDFTISADALIKAFTSDEAASNKLYLDKSVAVSGMVKSLDKDEKGYYTVVLGDTASTASVRCSVDSLHNAEVSNVKPGETLLIKGFCTGFTADDLGLGADVILNRSAVCKNK
jgi:tRNA_anti-like